MLFDIALRTGLFIGLLGVCNHVQAQPALRIIQVDTVTSFRALSAVSTSTVWISGNGGKVYRVEDEGLTVIDCSPLGYEAFDFRDIHAWDAQTALLMAVASPAVFLKTDDGGQHWREVYRNESEMVFFDALDFWDAQRGIAFSDAIGDRLLLVETTDGGNTWSELPIENQPLVTAGQGGFAASGSCLKTYGEGLVAIGLGGVEATVLSSSDFGQTWRKSVAPIDQGTNSAGVFSLAFIDAQTLLAVGGDYRADSLSHRSIALSRDAAQTWLSAEEVPINLKGLYRSCIVAVDDKEWWTVSRTGSSVTFDGGQNWTHFDWRFYTAQHLDGVLWMSGPEGRLGRVIR